MSRSHATISAVAARYAKAIFELAVTAKNEAAVVQAFAALAEALRENAAAEDVLSNPQISREKKSALLQAALKGAPALAINAARTIAEQGRANDVIAIADSMVELLREQSGAVSAHVISANKLSSQQEQEIAKLVGKFTGKKADLTTSTNPNLIGGFTVSVGSTLIDASVNTRLNQLRQQLLQAAAS